MNHANNCMCVPYFPDHLLAPNIQPTSQDKDLNEEFTTTINFDSIPIGRAEKRSFKIQNNSKVTHTYTIEENAKKNKIFNFFELKISNSAVKSGDYLSCSAFYRPQVVNERNVDYIKILDDLGQVYKICLKGECLGPNVVASITRLVFFETKNSSQLSNVFELSNTSSVAITFQFEVNQEESARPLFTVDKSKGRLEPFQHHFFKVKFVSKKPGVFFQPLVCLLSYHAPILIDLVGVKTNRECDCFLKKPSIKTFPMELEETQGYSGYMYDSLVTMIHKPPFSLSSNYLNFERIEFGKKFTLITCLTNHLSKSVEVVWDNADCPPFSIKPKEITIPAGESVLYECQYKPILPDQLDLRILRASIYWSPFTSDDIDYAQLIEVPLALNMRVFGHSFAKNKEWFPKIEINPEITILPPTIPSSPRYTTFIMRNLGSLPTSFAFVPPEKTKYLVKPMIGIVDQYQIVVVQLQPNCCEKVAYTEKWLVQLNGRTEDCCFLRMKGYAESPILTIGVDNTVAFKTVFPECQDISTVMIKNPSPHFLEYELEQHEDLFIDRPKGTLAPSEKTFLKWYSTGRIKSPEVSTIQCKFRSSQESQRVIGHYCDTHVTVYQKCAYSELCATPNEHNFKEVRFGETRNAVFHLYNFGESTINFQLISKNSTNTIDDLQLVPSSGSVYPREKVEINLRVTINKTKHEDIVVAYQIRLNELSSDLIDCCKSYKVYHLKYFGIYPTLQVEDILSHNFGFLFSKIVLWDLFNIDQINKILREIQHDETKSVEMFLPEFEMGDADFSATLILRNVTNFDTKLKPKKIKNCNCKLIKKAIGMSFSCISDDCVHKEMFKFTLEDDLIRANAFQKVRLEVKYLEHGLSQIFYKLILSNKRIINCYINVYVLPKIVTKPSTYIRHLQLNFKNVFIGEKQPATQSVLPLYNNSEFLVDFEIDETSLKRLNFDYKFEIFKCFNCEDTIPAFSTRNILFTFVPIEAREYKVAVSIRMGNEIFFLELHGKGVINYQIPSCKVESTMPLTSMSDLQKVIELSVEHIVVKPFPVWSTVYKMFFIRNLTPNKVIGYSWQTCTAAQSIKVEAVYKKGVLEPKQSRPIIIQIHSFDNPCQLRLQLVCKLLDHTQYVIHKRSLIEFNAKQQELEGQFCITEDGIAFPINDVIVQPKPETFYVTLSMDIYISSVLDRDLHANMKEQLTYSPQYSLRLNMENIKKSYLRTVRPKKSQTATAKSTADGQPKKQLNRADLDQARMFKRVSECIIADVLFGNLFCNALTTTENSHTPFYIQFNLKDQHTENKKKAPRDPAAEKRLALANDFLNKPQLPLLASIFTELIADSLHELFQLGPQIKSLSHTKPNYRAINPSIVCSVCKCD